MAINVLLLHYNNYFNRTIKKLETVDEYKAADSESVTENDVTTVIPHWLETTGVNFVPGDGIATSFIVGTSNISDMDFDYFLVYESVTEGQVTTNTIKSRWFILEESRTRDGQYELGLRRDVIADNYDQVLDATTYIEKGNVQADNPLLFNKEGLMLNQIKESELLLKDKSTCPWIVGYIAKDAYTGDVTINYNPENHDYIEVAAATIDDWEYKTYEDNKFLGPLQSSSFSTYYQCGEWWIYNWAGYATITGGAGKAWGKAEGTHNYALRTTWWADKEDQTNKLLNAYINLGFSKFNTSLMNLVGSHTQTQFNDFLSYKNKVIKTQNGKFYKVLIVDTGVLEENNKELNSGNQLYSLMTAAVENSNAFTDGYETPDSGSFKYSYKCATYKVSLVELFNQTVTTKVSSNRKKSKDSLYDIFCIPYGDISVGSASGIDYNPEFQTSEELGVATAVSLAISLGGGGAASKIYDLQLLPYCPVQSQINDEGELTVDGLVEHEEFEYIYDNSGETPVAKGVMFYVPNGSFTLDINKTIDYERFAHISGFTDITIPGGWTATLQTYQDYVLSSLETPQAIIDLGSDWIDDNGWYNISALATNPSRMVNQLIVKKINKVSGAIIQQYDAYQIEAHMCTDQTQNVFKINKYVDGAVETLETITKAEYDSADYYIAYQVASAAHGGRGIDQYWAIASKIPIYDYEVSQAMALKVDNECNMYRMVSPNYQGEFEFSVAKNNGVDYFNVDCTYKPYNPYIHVNPNFKNLYGQDFNDGRGLICNGDFSFGMVSDAFTNYELQNKNYQAIFNRQIQNMDVNNAIAKEEAVVQAIAGTVQGTATGAAAGAMVGGGYGAIAGAVVGLGTSMAGGIADVVNLEKRQKEAKSFAIDNYNYSLQNIHALSYSLTKCTALTYNNKLYPFVEKWTCTPEEREALIRKLQYDGMTVNKIGKIQDYTGNDILVRGEIIRFNGTELKSDAHMANEIFVEIKKGVYL